MCTDCKISRDLLLGYFFSKRATKPTAHSPYPAKIPGGYYRAAGRYHQHASCTLHAASSATLQSKCPLPTAHTSRVRMPCVIAGPWPSAERTDPVARHTPTARCRHPHTHTHAAHTAYTSHTTTSAANCLLPLHGERAKARQPGKKKTMSRSKQAKAVKSK